MESKNSIFSLGTKYNTNKIYHHGYHRYYEDFLLKYKKKKFNFLEIGMDVGKSLFLWRDYFPKAFIYGLEIKQEYIDKNIFVIKGDQSSLKDLKKLVSITNKCNVIIDDGSHVPEHQLISFNYLFKHCLSEDGIYIIEDIETSYWRKDKKAKLYGYNIDSGYDSKNNIVNIFRDIVPIVNREFISKENKKNLIKKSRLTEYCINNISSIMFGMNCIIIKKISNYEKKKFTNRKYRYKKFI